MSQTQHVIKPLKRCNTPLLGLVKSTPQNPGRSLASSYGRYGPWRKGVPDRLPPQMSRVGYPLPPKGGHTPRGGCDVRGLDAMKGEIMEFFGLFVFCCIISEVIPSITIKFMKIYANLLKINENI